VRPLYPTQPSQMLPNIEQVKQQTLIPYSYRVPMPDTENLYAMRVYLMAFLLVPVGQLFGYAAANEVMDCIQKMGLSDAISLVWYLNDMSDTVELSGTFPSVVFTHLADLRQ
jgi:hypothetical protein